MEYGGQVTSEEQWTTGSPSAPSRFVAYGDTQDYNVANDNTVDHDNEITQRTIVSRAYSYHPDLVVRVGDQVNYGNSTLEWEYFFAIERPLLSSTLYLTVPGNHEYTNSGSYPSGTLYYDLFALPPAPASEQYYAVKHGNTLFIGLNTEIAIAGTQTQWLEDTLNPDVPDADIKWKVVSFHQPAYSSGVHGSNGTVQTYWVPLFEQYGVDVVLNGHDHSYEHSLVNGVHYLVSGGGGSDLRSISGTPGVTVYAESVHHFLVVDVDDQQLSVAPYRVDGSAIDEAFTLTAAAP